MYRLATAICFLFCSAAEAQFGHGTHDDLYSHMLVPSYRLNLTVKPLHYSLRMRPILDDVHASLPKFTVPSSVKILVQSFTDGKCNVITLHQRNLTIDLGNVTVKNYHSEKYLRIQNQSFEEARDLYTLTLEDEFELGDILEIFVPYTVSLSQTENVGIYLGHYENPYTNQTHYLATTKLEPYHARKVFPLFDEPNLKATFQVSVARLENKYHSLSNTEILRTEKDTEYDGWVWDVYHETVLMSSYLFCVIVSDFASDTIEYPELNRTVSTWAPKHDIDLQGGTYGADTGLKLVNFYETTFKMNYALRKLDAVALPQFASGAMENFGLVTYRYEYLVWIPGESTEAERRKVTQVLAHEITHQWFGNIVTCDWWSEIWLNEGFARYMQFWGMAECLPEFRVEEAFVNDATQLAMVFDQGPLTHPVRNSAESTTESAAVFDRISYEKAASLLKMLEGVLGKELLLHGLVDVYLQKMKWDNARQEDLFQSIQEAVEAKNATRLLPPGITVNELMKEWTLTSGYPLVRIEAVNRNSLLISQERFALNGSKVTADQRWWVPVKVVTSFPVPTHAPDLWLSNKESSVLFFNADLDTSKLVMVNPDASAYYRVLYDSGLTSLIKRQLDDNHEVISRSSRSQLLDDYFTLAAGKKVDIETALEFTEYLGKEASSNVWTAALTHLKPIHTKFSESEEAHDAFSDYMIPRLEGTLGLVGIRQAGGERGINVTLRAQLLDMGCHLGILECTEYAQELMNEWMRNPQNNNPFPVDIKSTLLCTAVASSDSAVWNFLLSQVHQTRKTTLKTPLLNALACSRNETILKNLLHMSVSSLNAFTEQILTKVAANREGRELCYEFAKEEVLSSRITPSTFANTISVLSGYWGDNRRASELQEFIDQHGNELDTVLSSLETSMKNVKGNIEWWSTFGMKIQAWLLRKE